MLHDGIRLVGDTDISRELVSRRGAEFPDSPSTGDIFQLIETSVNFPSKGPGIYIWSSAENTWIEQTETERDPYDMSVTIVGRPKPDAIVATVVMARTAILLANLTKSKAIAQTAPTSQAVFNIDQVNIDGDVTNSLGTITFEAGQKIGTVAATVPDTETILAEDEIISIKAPLVRDATLKEISITLAGRLAVLND